jgi:hypothetical protein
VSESDALRWRYERDCLAIGGAVVIRV